ncbi:hypothetical protein [Neolewinella persica]|uniref:hypothetical protein n=1 Tax=Neolewinella persica TaxID=70998 RepID=UPI0003735275|nr:hypothetical protein [Neolewinella persica]
MNNAYNLFLQNCQNGVLVEMNLVSKVSSSLEYAISLKGEILPDNRSNKVMAYLRTDLQTGRLLIHFIRSSIFMEPQSRYFFNDFFTAPTNLSLSPLVVKALGWKRGEYHLRKGSYPMLDEAGFCTVSGRVGSPQKDSRHTGRHRLQAGSATGVVG